jgi:hypothetical protein
MHKKIGNISCNILLDITKKIGYNIDSKKHKPQYTTWQPDSNSGETPSRERQAGINKKGE